MLNKELLKLTDEEVMKEVCKYFYYRGYEHPNRCSCFACPINCVCNQYIEMPKEDNIEDWDKADIKTAIGIIKSIIEIIEKKGEYIPIWELDLDNITLEEFNMHPSILVLEYLKSLSSNCDKLD